MTLKGGASLLRMPIKVRDEHQKDIIEHAVMIADLQEPGELAGFVVIGWDANGIESIGYFLAEKGPVSPTMAPHFIADALRRKLIACDLWDER